MNIGSGDLTRKDLHDNSREMHRALAEKLPTMMPDVWAAVYPRAFTDAGGWYSPREAGVDMASLLSLGASVAIDTPTASGLAVTSRLIDLGVPTYFVQRDFLGAILNTTPPTDLMVRDINWPMEAMIFMLPTGAIMSPVDGPLKYVAFCRCRGGEMYQSRNFSFVPDIAAPSQTDCLAFFGHTENSMLYGGTIDFGSRSGLWDVIKLDEAAFANVIPEGPLGEIENLVTEPMSNGDRQFLVHVQEVAIRLLLMMQFLPEAVTVGAELRKGSEKNGRRRSSLWSPNILGEGYRAKREAFSEGEGGSKRAHWRRGHWRSQAHGVQHALHKRLWIEPVFVSGPRTPAC